MAQKKEKDIKTPKQPFKHDPGDVPKLIGCGVIILLGILGIVINLFR